MTRSPLGELSGKGNCPDLFRGFKGINKREKLILLIILKRIFVEIIKVRINKEVNNNSEVAFKRIK